MADLEGGKQPLLLGRRRLAALLGEGSSSESAESGTTSRRSSDAGCLHGSGCKAVLLLAAVLATAALGTFRHTCNSLVPADQYPHFLVVGDWGRGGDFNQTAVASAMARKAASMRTDFIISTGDNFYPSGLLSPEDPAFETSFSTVYSQGSLQVPWHAVLGNHDHGEADEPSKPPCSSWDPDCFYSPLHELDVRLAERDPRWHCERSFVLSLAGGTVEIFFIDTTPVIKEYREAPWRADRGGLAEQSWEGQMRELEARLARSQAAWKLVVGHHPIRTNHRPFHSWREMVRSLEPLLSQYGVQAYLCGHDHNLQLLHKPGTGYYHVTSGAGSKVGPEFNGKKHSLFQYGGNGFVAVRLSASWMTVEFMGLDLEEPLYSLRISSDGTQHSADSGGSVGSE